MSEVCSSSTSSKSSNSTGLSSSADIRPYYPCDTGVAALTVSARFQPNISILMYGRHTRVSGRSLLPVGGLGHLNVLVFRSACDKVWIRKE